MKKTFVIFDLDGTLLNTIDDLGTAANVAMEQLGYPTHSMIAYKAMVGDGVTKLIERALPTDVRNERTVTDARRRFADYYDNHCCDYTAPYPGIELLIRELASRGINLGVASNKYQRAVSRLVSYYFPGIQFKAVLGQREGVPVKPDPSIIFEALNICPTPKAEVLYVGDSGNDIVAGKRACVDTVGVTWGFRPAVDLTAAYADYIIDDPAELLGLV